MTTTLSDSLCRPTLIRVNTLCQWLLPLCLLLTSYTTTAASDPEPVGEGIVVQNLSEIKSGSLLIPADAGNHYLRAPLLNTSVQIDVQGMLARTRVEQTFTNDTNRWIEAVYVFPLPDDASVDELTMLVADKEINGVIQPKSKARKIYNDARQAGKKASLLEQQRANLFTTRLANIAPGETALIRIAYQSSVQYSNGQFELMFPLTITPRYIPGTATTYNSEHLYGSGSQGWALPTQTVPDAGEITPPTSNSPAPVAINVSIDAGLDGLTINSNTHDIITTPDDTRSKLLKVELAGQTVRADRDFKLNWTPAATKAPVAAVFRQDTQVQQQTHSFASFMLMPPQQIYTASHVPREVIFVMDTSSSMSGNSIQQARAALMLGIERLTNDDLFNVIEFDNNTSTLFATSVNANSANKVIAGKWIKQLHANGGTEILGALQAALNLPPADERLRQIVFVTDGSVGNEDQIFRYLQSNIADTRLFTVGIGSAPNTWFMRRAAETGRGSYTTIANGSELSTKMMHLLKRLESPALTDVRLTFDTDTVAEIYPTTLPDVYLGEPVLADARWTDKLNNGSVEISGTYAGNTWSQKLRLNAVETSSASTGLDKLWAHRKIQSLENDLLFNTDLQETEDAITNIAMDYSLVSRYTSLVAVEQKASRDIRQTDLQTVAVPQAIPAGNTMLFPQGSLGTRFKFIVSLLFAILSVAFGLASLRQTRQFSQPLYRHGLYTLVLSQGKGTVK